MRKSRLFGIIFAIALVVGLGGILGLMLLWPRSSEQSPGADSLSDLEQPGTAMQQVSQDCDPRPDEPVPWRENARSTVRLIAEKKAGERAVGRPKHEGEARHAIYPKGYVKWKDGHVNWKARDAALDPDETDGAIGAPRAGAYRRWWSDPPFHGE